MVPCGVCLRRRVEARCAWRKVPRECVAAGGTAMCVFRRALWKIWDWEGGVALEGCVVFDARERFFFGVDIVEKCRKVLRKSFCSSDRQK